MNDFAQIRTMSGGQRHSFEELVCQLARREEVVAGSVFRRVEGSGGDGGVEAYWLLPDRSKYGYQAKFFTRAGDIAWEQIDESVGQALKTHPTLTRYFIAIPCDLTDRRGTQGRGLTGWELWGRHEAKWQESVKAIGRDVEFVPWTAFDLRDKLSLPSAVGLRRYWFGKVEFSPLWFRQHTDLATASLDERYHPEDHVDVKIEKLFRFVTRHPSALSELQERLAEIRRSSQIDHQFRDNGTHHSIALIEKTKTALNVLLSIAVEFDLPFWQEWNIANWGNACSTTAAAVSELQNWTWARQSELPDHDKTKNELNRTSRVLVKLGDAIESFEHIITGPYLAAEQHRSALIVGRAGTGKSHLLGKIADEAIREGRPVLLILGQQFNDQPLWDQLLSRFGISQSTPDEFLEALDSAAEASRQRALILVDAVNEGAGARLWRSELVGFVERIKRFPNVACFITCRSEYVPYVLPEGLLTKIPQFEIRGFETTKEQVRAAKIYLDKRGISRPSTPWLAPEFINPLFLRSASVALSREGKSEFPRGLIGTKSILQFYIRSAARNLGVGRDGSDDLLAPTIGTLRTIASQMALKQRDYLSLAEAGAIANHQFSAFYLDGIQSWLDVLHRNGFLRKDPDPNTTMEDPLTIAEDVIRFSFQRFQDHLMAEALLMDVTNIAPALASGGALSFIHDGKTLEWQWQGLVEALSIQIPERFKSELVDELPGGTTHWWRIWQISDAFVESIRWRDKAAFSNRTLELLNKLPESHLDRFSILIELSASVDHPWNAVFLHHNLSRRTLPQRDRFWTVYVNEASTEDDRPVGALIDWCLFGQTPNVDRKIQYLCAITLCWFFTSTNRTIRDRATKALAALLVFRSDLLPELVELFDDVNDIYLPERLFAAAFGACCLDPSESRLTTYAATTFKAVFAKNEVPLSLLLRDYGRGIVELCLANSTLPPNVSVDRTRPPYRSPRPRLTISKADVERAASSAGESTIMHSCSNVMGDFGSHEIKARVESFTAVSLSKPQPFSKEEIFNRFETEVIDVDPARVKAVEGLRKASLAGFDTRWLRVEKGDGEKPTKADLEWAKGVALAEKHLTDLLSPAERRRYEKEAAARLGHRKDADRDPPRIDIAQAQYWVAKRAYDLGWTKKLFPNDSSGHTDYSGNRPTTERIGKKYQWIALDELLCRLADNYWIGGRYGNRTKRYEYSTDIGFYRDIDPTILSFSNDPIDTQSAVTKETDIILSTVDEAGLCRWPFLEDPTSRMANYVSGEDDAGRKWITLYEHRSKTERYDDLNISSQPHTLRQQEFRFVLCIIVEKGHREALVEFLLEKKNLDVSEWSPPEYTDGPFFRETPWRRTWPQDQWTQDSWSAPRGLPFAFPVLRYHWESHLDAALPDGARALIPAPWLARALSLIPDHNKGSQYYTKEGQLGFCEITLDEGGSCALVSEHLLEDLLKSESLECVWLFVGERNAWPAGNNSNAAWRRSEGICWRENGRTFSVGWNKDTANGSSKAEPTGLQTKKS
jgi:hypothetical protein